MSGHELLEAFRSHLDERHQYLCQRLDDLDDNMRLLYGALISRMDEHDAYHRRNEHRWGLVRLAQRHPWRLAAMAFVCGLTVILIPKETSSQLISDVVQMILNFLVKRE